MGDGWAGWGGLGEGTGLFWGCEGRFGRVRGRLAAGWGVWGVFGQGRGRGRTRRERWWLGLEDEAVGLGDEGRGGPASGYSQEEPAGVAGDPGGGMPVGPAHGLGPGPPQFRVSEADGLEPENQGVSQDDRKQPGLVASERLEREPLAAGVFDAGDVVLDAGVAADVEIGLRRGERLVGPCGPGSGIRLSGTKSAGRRGVCVHGG